MITGFSGLPRQVRDAAVGREKRRDICFIGLILGKLAWPSPKEAFASIDAVFRLLASRSLMISLVNNSMPQLVWWITNHSRVPSSL